MTEMTGSIIILGAWSARTTMGLWCLMDYCPKHLHPFVSSLIESSARVAPYSSASLHDTDVLKTIRESIDDGTMSGPLFSRLVGLDEIGSKRLLAGEKVELTYRSMISILRLADVLRK